MSLLSSITLEDLKKPSLTHHGGRGCGRAAGDVGAVACRRAAGAGDSHLSRRYFVLDTLPVRQRGRLVTETDTPGHVGRVGVTRHSTRGQ